MIVPGIGLRPRLTSVCAPGRERGQPPPITLSLTPLGLDLALGALTVEAVSAGPVWQGGGCWESDGTAYLLCDSTLALTGECEVVVQWSRASAGIGHALYGTKGSTQATRGYSTSTSVNHTLYTSGSGGISRAATVSEAVSGSHVYSYPMVSSAGNYRPKLGRDGGALTDADGALGAVGTATLYIGASDIGGFFVAWAGVKVYGVAIYQRTLSDAERLAMAKVAGSVAQVNPLSVASDAPICLDMRNAESVEGVMRVPNLGTGGASYRFSQVNGTSARFGVGAFV